MRQLGKFYNDPSKLASILHPSLVCNTSSSLLSLSPLSPPSYLFSFFIETKYARVHNLAMIVFTHQFVTSAKSRAWPSVFEHPLKLSAHPFGANVFPSVSLRLAIRHFARQQRPFVVELGRGLLSTGGPRPRSRSSESRDEWFHNSR